MTDYASVGAARVRYCHCHDEPTAFEPTKVVESKAARFSAGAGTFARAVFGSLRGRFAQQPMLIGKTPGGMHVDLIGRRGTRPDLIGGIGWTQGEFEGIAVGASGELIMNPLNPQVVTRFGATEPVDDSPLGRAKENLGKVDDSLRPFGTLAGFVAGVLGTWMVLDAVQASKDSSKFDAAGAAAGDRSRRRGRRRRWF